MRGMQLNGIDPEPGCAARRRHKASLARRSPSRSNAIGATLLSANGTAEGASVCQPWGTPGAICAPPFHGTSVEDLRPAWLSWMAIGMFDQRRMPSSVLRMAASV